MLLQAPICHGAQTPSPFKQCTDEKSQSADITTRQARLPGNATLEIRNQSPTSSRVASNGVDLFTDDGTYYLAGSESALPQVIAQGQDVGEGQFKRAISAALLAVNGNLATARSKMDWPVLLR